MSRGAFPTCKRVASSNFKQVAKTGVKMLKKPLTALTCKAKKSNEITRIKIPAQFAVHPTSISENHLKNRCPICGGDGVLWFGSVISNKSLPFQDKCPVCDGYGCGNEFDSIRLGFSRYEKRVFFNILCKKESFKTRLDVPKFLPMVVSK